MYCNMAMQPLDNGEWNEEDLDIHPHEVSTCEEETQEEDKEEIRSIYYSTWNDIRYQYFI